jgi:hypothetical protein
MLGLGKESAPMRSAENGQNGALSRSRQLHGAGVAANIAS